MPEAQRSLSTSTEPTRSWVGVPQDRLTPGTATVAVGRSVLVIVWRLLSDPQARYHDLGADICGTASARNARTRTTSANSKDSAIQSHPPNLSPELPPHRPSSTDPSASPIR